MPLRALIRIILVIAVAILAALLLRGLFVASSSTPPPPKMAAVESAARPLPAGTLLTADDLVTRDVPEGDVTKTMIVKGSPQAARLIGAVVRNAVAEAADINPVDVVFPDAPGFLAAALQPGMRAVSVAIDDVTGNAGLILPADRVDLLLTQRLEGHGGSDASRPVASETVLSDLRVIAVGSLMKAPPETATDNTANPQRAAHTVTLEVTPEDAEKVAVATRLGQLSLSLRSLAVPATADARNDDGAADTNASSKDALPGTPAKAHPVWAEDVSMAVRDLASHQPPPQTAATAPPSPPSAPPLRVFRGSSKESGDGDRKAFAAFFGAAATSSSSSPPPPAPSPSPGERPLQ